MHTVVRIFSTTAFCATALWPSMATAGIVDDVRAAIAAKDFPKAERQTRDYQKARGATPELAQAVSWLARGALAAKELDRADAFAAQARKMALETLGSRKLDNDQWLPLALGAAIEVHGQALNARGEKAAAVEYLEGEFKTYGKTSLAERIQKNINLISLEGKPAPALEAREWLGPKPVTLASLKGRPVLLFFWAHWCPDCKAMVPILTSLMKTYGPKGLALVGPTRYYGYTAGAEGVPPPLEKPYIDEVRRRYYATLAAMPAPLANANFITYGASSTPTIVLVDAQGIVRWYHPGSATEQELAARIQPWLK